MPQTDIQTGQKLDAPEFHSRGIKVKTYPVGFVPRTCSSVGTRLRPLGHHSLWQTVLKATFIRVIYTCIQVQQFDYDLMCIGTTYLDIGILRNCLTSQLTIFQSYMWRHIDVQADWRRSWTYGRAPNAIDIS